jgi:hypothetical protein
LPRPKIKAKRPSSAPSCTGTPHELWSRETLWRLHLERNSPSASAASDGHPTSQQAKMARPGGSGMAAVAALASSLRGEFRHESSSEVEEEILRKVDRLCS